MRLMPSDTQDFAYTVTAFSVAVGGALKVKLYDGSVQVLTVSHGAIVNLPVRRIFRTGTTCTEFQTDVARNADYATRNQIVPFAGDLDAFSVPSIYGGTGAILLLASTVSGAGTLVVPARGLSAPTVFGYRNNSLIYS